MKALKVFLIAIGGLFALAGVALLVGSLALGGAYSTQRDADGYFTAGAERFESSARAITTDQFDLLVERNLPDGLPARLGQLRVRAEAPSDLFIGIGPADQVEAYLANVARDQITRIETEPFQVEYRRTPGSGAPAAPAQQDFWAVQATGPGSQTVAWDLESGRWMAVLMNADGSPGVQADVELGARSELVGWAIGVLALSGLLFLLAGSGMILGGIGLDASGAALPAAQPQLQPVRIEGRLDEPLSRWLWLVKWLLALPHFVVLAFLWIAFALLTFVAGTAILFTGRYPRAIFAFNVGVLRWTWRVGYYATSALGTDRYPPFSLGAAPDYPATLEIAYPEHLSRRLVLVKWWLLAIPHYLVLALLTSAPVVAWNEWGGSEGIIGGASVAGLLVLFAGVVLLFRGQYPAGVYALVMGINRWSYRVLAYVGLMTDVYPPFRLDQGALEPANRAAD